jgi:uncharacterized membrane protein HdeD (DUF308 family)
MSGTGVQVVRRNWWLLAVRGLLSIILGLIVLFLPGIALLALVYVFAAYMLIDGIMAVVTSIQERGMLNRWGWILFEGVLGIVAGLIAFFYPGITALILLYLVAAWAIITGIMEIVTAFIIRDMVSWEWLLALAGVVSVIFGIILFIHPGAGLLSILWLVGVYSIIFGVTFIVRAFQHRSWTPVLGV